MREIRALKKQIREEYLEKRSSIDPARKREMDERLCELFTSLTTFRYSDDILLYAPKGSEVNVMLIAERALRAGKRVAFPLCDPEQLSMSFHFVESTSQLVPGSYGLLEPPPELPVYDKASGRSAVCVVPGIVFDKNGYRIGYGKGYYDRYFADFKGSRVGLVYSELLKDRLPRGKFDRAMDIVITEKGVKIITAPSR